MNTDNGCADHTVGDGPVLIGCGILSREVRHLIRKNSWPMETVLFDSALHNDFRSLGTMLESALMTHRSQTPIVFYGCCHPLMDSILSEAGALRTQGQNCVEMLLGHEVFATELDQGAYFLFESWARNWKNVLQDSLGTSQPDVIRAIFREDRKYLLALRTPCSGDFVEAAEAAGRIAGLPVRWMDVRLDHLEQTIADALFRRSGGARQWIS